MRHPNQRLARFALLPTFAAALVMGAHAQTQVQGSGAQAMGAGQGQTAPAADYRAMRASEVIGADVRNAQGRDIGQIEDMVISMQDGRVRYAVLSVDPGWFQSDRLYSVPPQQLRWGADRDQIVLNNVDRQQLERGGIERSEWNPQFLGDAGRRARLDNAWSQASGGTLARASDVLGKEVRGRGGENIGTVEELVLNTARGEVHYAVVSFDPGWLQAEKRAALPLRALNHGPNGDQLVLDMGQQQVAGLRDFNTQQYSKLNDRAFVTDVDRYLVILRTAQPAHGGQPAARTGAQTSQAPLGSDHTGSNAMGSNTAGSNTMAAGTSSWSSDPQAPQTSTLGAGPDADTRIDTQPAPIADRG